MKKYLLLACVAIAMLVVGCSKDNPDNPVNPKKPDTPEIPSRPSLRLQNSKAVLFRESKEKIVVENASESVTYRTQNPLIATVSNDGVVTGVVRGETNITVRSGNDSVFFHVKVETRINTLVEPNLEFGQSYDYIKSQIPKEAESVKEMEGGILFYLNVSGVRCLYLYMFNNDRLTACSLSFPIQDWRKMALADFLNERYISLGKVGDKIGYVSPDGKIIAFAGRDETLKSYMTIMYTTSEKEQSSLKSQHQSSKKILYDRSHILGEAL